jgi:hypothetical protein
MLREDAVKLMPPPIRHCLSEIHELSSELRSVENNLEGGPLLSKMFRKGIAAESFDKFTRGILSTPIAGEVIEID